MIQIEIMDLFWVSIFGITCYLAWNARYRLFPISDPELIILRILETRRKKCGTAWYELCELTGQNIDDTCVTLSLKRLKSRGLVEHRDQLVKEQKDPRNTPRHKIYWITSDGTERFEKLRIFLTA